MALPATDTFTRADGELAAGSANWAKCSASSGNMNVNTNAVQSASLNENGYLWTADTFSNDQYAQVTIAAVTNSVFVGPACRVANGTYSYYGYYGDGSLGAFPFKQVAGTWTQFGTTLGVFAASNTIRIEASGTAITFKRNGATDRTQTDSALTSGSAGITGQGNNAGSKLDNWEGGNLAAAAAGPFPPWPPVQRIIVRG